jgi:GNAT superfamily N-acetyltransferase
MRGMGELGSGLRIETLAGPAVAATLGDVARLRIEVFRDWPYLYDGSLDDERGYLAEFAAAKDAIVIAAFDGQSAVGVATAAPLAGHTRAFMPAFERAGFDPNRIFFCGESVLLPAYRGCGIGHAFFDRREAHARASTGARGAYTHTAFCGVIRAAGDPRMPEGYRPLDAFWMKRGYRPVEGLTGSYSWRETGEVAETEKAMQFWIRAL